MDKMIAHNEKDAQKRRATWEEKYLFFQTISTKTPTLTPINMSYIEQE